MINKQYPEGSPFADEILLKCHIEAHTHTPSETEAD